MACSNATLYETAAYLVAEATTLVVDAAVFSTPVALAELLPDYAGDVPSAVKEAVCPMLSTSRKTLTWLGTTFFPSWMGASYAEAAEHWRQRFLQAHPQHEPNLSDGTALVTTTMVIFLLLLCTVLCTKWLLSWGCGGGSRPTSELLLFPDRSGRHVAKLCAELRGARRHLLVAVGPLTDDLISTEVLRAHFLGVDTRVVVAPGADVQRLEQAGVRVARTDGPMGHRFVLVDGMALAGSFRWTREACESSHGHLYRCCDGSSVRALRAEFECLWRSSFRPGRSAVKSRQRRAATPPPPCTRGGA